MRIKELRLRNFKQFRTLTMKCHDQLNIIIGDNETGKSTILEAIDLVLRGSVYSVDALGLENLLNHAAVTEFMQDSKSIKDLPELRIEVVLDDTENIEVNGRSNSAGSDANGLKLVCEIDYAYTEKVKDLLKKPHATFPYEFYSVKFSKFSDLPYAGHRERIVRHLFIDTARIDQANATQTYVRNRYESYTDDAQRAVYAMQYRSKKEEFNQTVLTTLNSGLGKDSFRVRTDAKANLEADLTIYRDDIPIFNRGKGMQNILKVKFGLSKAKESAQVVLLEEPENHLAYRLMKEQIEAIQKDQHVDQLFVTTHNNRISSRLGLDHCVMLCKDCVEPGYFDKLDPDTAKYFMKAPDSKALEFVLSPRVILVEGHAEYILLEKLYQSASQSTLDTDGVHVIAIGGKHFAHYMELAKVVGNKVAVILDNDGDGKVTCDDRFTEYGNLTNLKMFYDQNSSLRSFEYSMESVNADLCKKLFGNGKNGVVQYMLDYKTKVAMDLLKCAETVNCPAYIKDAVAWVRLST